MDQPEDRTTERAVEQDDWLGFLTEILAMVGEDASDLPAEERGNALARYRALSPERKKRAILLLGYDPEDVASRRG